MIDKVSEIRIVKASDLPPTFDIMVGNNVYPFELDSMDDTYVYMIDTASGESVYIPRDAEMSILVPDTWDNAKWDIGLSLMNDGIL
jgi:hypothetical protein